MYNNINLKWFLSGWEKQMILHTMAVTIFTCSRLIKWMACWKNYGIGCKPQPGYKDNTTLLITTDHGRGKKDNSWTSHGSFIAGSSETWLAMIGPGLQPLGEVKEDQQLYQKANSNDDRRIGG